MEAALNKKDKLLKKYPQVVIRDNTTRKEKIYQQEDKKGLIIMENRELVLTYIIMDSWDRCFSCRAYETEFMYFRR